MILAGLVLALGIAGKIASAQTITEAYSPANGTTSLYYLSADRHVQQIWIDGTGVWHYGDLTAYLGAPLAAVGSTLTSAYDPINSTLLVYYIGADQHINQLWLQGGIWHISDMTLYLGAPNAAIESPITAIYNPAGNTFSAYYLSGDQHVQEIWIDGNGVWNYGDLTAYLGAPLAAAGSTLTPMYNPIGSTLAVYYIGADQHINQLWLQGGIWNISDMTLYLSAPNAIIGSPITAIYSPAGNTFSVYYLSADQHVQQFWMGANSSWNYGDFTAYMGAPLAAVGSTLASVYNPTNPGGPTTEVYYIGADQHLYQFWLLNNIWHLSDLSAYLGAPNATNYSPLSAYYNPLSQTDEIYYLSADYQLQQLWMPANGVWNLSGNFTAYMGAPTAAPPVSQPAIVQLTNLTHPDLSPNFEVGDTFQITIIGPPNQPVSLTQTPGTTAEMGYTDANGNFTLTGVEQTSNIGSYTQVWSVAGTPITPAISFVVVQLAGGGTVSTTDIGQTSDGSVLGISTLSIGNGAVSTYSVTELDYNASLYYNAKTVGTLFQDGTAIVQGVSPVSGGSAGGGLSATAVPWATYDLQTDHYVVIPEIFFVDGYYQNTLYLGAGSCYEVSSDCTIGSGGGFYLVVEATIYLGSTLADQTNVPQDGSMPPINDALYDNFLSSSEPPYPTGAVFKAEVKEWLKRLATVSLLGASVATDVMSNSPPVPYMVELLPPPAGDEYAPNPAVIPPQGERQRTYILKDAQGHPWPNAPVIVRERFSDKAGPGPLPAANGVWYYSLASPGPTAVVLDHSQMTDHYGLSGLPPLEVGYVQYYYASSFTSPSWLQLPPGFSLPGVSIPGPVVPLWIKDRFNSCEAALGGYYTMLAGQPVRLNPNYTGIDGDNGPPPAQGCAPPF